MNLRISLVEVNRTDLVCIACGGFRTEMAIATSGELQVGLHKKCIPLVKAHNRRKDSHADED
jgi:hypothetical protein